MSFDSQNVSSTDSGPKNDEQEPELSRDLFECFACGFASSSREEFDQFGLAIACPECQSLRVEHVFTPDDDDAELVTDGGLPTCEDCGDVITHTVVAGPGEAKHSCGCDAEPIEVADDTEIGIANVAIHALNASGDADTAAAIHQGTRGRLIADGGVPESFDELASTCESCGEDVDPERLIEGECPGCHYHEPVADGGVSWYDLHSFQRDILRVIAEIEGDGDTSYGLGIKRGLEERYTKEVNHGRLYPNLDDLVAFGLVEKSELDKRTNRYSLRDEGVAMLRRQKEDWDDLEVPEVVAVADGGDSA